MAGAEPESLKALGLLLIQTIVNGRGRAIIFKRTARYFFSGVHIATHLFVNSTKSFKMELKFKIIIGTVCHLC